LSALFFSLPFPSLRFLPLRYRPHGVGNWSGHIPLACDLIATLRPSIFVELGTHLGESYFAFCQAITETGINAKAYAVDTWHGDLHTGAYGDEVFDEIAAYNRSRYAGFSQLLRMLFDEAIEHFKPESIDLLHIDGLHTYEAVRHDFDTWWPRVRPGGIVLLHDTFEQNADFGVWKLLNELSQELPTAEFRHSNGLGVVLKPGATPEQGLIPLLFSKEEDTFERLRRYYEICADHLEHKFWSERRRRPADWDVVTQLFWRGEGEDFGELASVRSSHTVTPQRSRLALPLPRMTRPPIELRLDLADCPAFFEVHAIALLSTNGEALWQWAEAGDVEELRNRGLHAVAAADGTGALVLDSPAGASFLLPAPESIVRTLQSGGQVVVEVTGLTPFSFVSKLATVFETRFIRQQAKLTETQTALDHAQNLAIERLEGLRHHDSALAEAQRLAWTKQTELESISAAFEGLISRLRADERTMAAELEETRAALRGREQDFADLAGRLGRIENSLAWRAVRSLTGFRSQKKY
jgi:hypothetical protein